MRAFSGAAIALGLALGLVACKPDIKDGLFACPDGVCPSGFTCRAEGDDPKRYCFSSEAASDSGAGTDGGAGIDGGADAGPTDAGPDLGSDASIDGGGGSTHARASFSLRSAGFWSEGATLSAESYTLHDHGFDRGVQMCTAGHELCVTGGFTP